MPLTPTQKLTLRTHIQANTTQLAFGGGTAAINTVFAGASLNAGDAALIAEWYGLQASPDYWAWRNSVSKGEFVNGIGPGGTTFNWTGAGFITRSVGERDAWREMFNHTNTVDPSRTNVRQAFEDIFSGAGVAAQNRAHLAAIARRLVNNLEKVFVVAATGPGNNGANPRGDSTNPDAMVVEGVITGDEISDIHGLPA